MKRGRKPQVQQVLEMLQRSEWVCGTEFIKAYLPNFPRSIHRLRHIKCCPHGVQPGCKIKDGYVIELQPCNRHTHLDSQWEYHMTTAGKFMDCTCDGTGWITGVGSQPSRWCSCPDGMAARQEALNI